MDISKAQGNDGGIHGGHAYLNSYSGCENQQFEFIDAGNGNYHIAVRSSGKYMDISQTSNGGGFDKRVRHKGYLYSNNANGKSNQEFKTVRLNKKVQDHGCQVKMAQTFKLTTYFNDSLLGNPRCPLLPLVV